MTIYDFTANDIDGNPVDFGKFRGDVLLVVNVASKCGFTSQYEGLQKLYETYRGRGFRVLGFPANDFLWQEPGTESEIKSFCSVAYGVTFPMFAKVSVRGKGICPLYAWLTDKGEHPELGGKVTWNFNKFLIDRDGGVIGRFGSRTKPLAKPVLEAIEAVLGGLSRE